MKNLSAGLFLLVALVWGAPAFAQGASKVIIVNSLASYFDGYIDSTTVPFSVPNQDGVEWTTQGPPDGGYYRNVPLLVENISLADFRLLYSRVIGKNGILMKIARTYGDGFTVWFGDAALALERTKVHDAFREYEYIFSLKAMYEKEKSRGVLVLVHYSRADPLDYDPSVFAKAFADVDGYGYQGYVLSHTFQGKDRKISGSSSGQISVSVLADGKAPIEVGGLKATTDDQGRFQFSGDTDLSAVAEGTIFLVDGDGRKITVVLDEATGKWGVVIAGKRANKPFRETLEIDPLNK